MMGIFHETNCNCDLQRRINHKIGSLNLKIEKAEEIRNEFVGECDYIAACAYRDEVTRLKAMRDLLLEIV